MQISWLLIVRFRKKKGGIWFSSQINGFSLTRWNMCSSIQIQRNSKLGLCPPCSFQYFLTMGFTNSYMHRAYRKHIVFNNIILVFLNHQGLIHFSSLKSKVFTKTIRNLQVVNPVKALTYEIGVGNPIFLSLLSFPNNNLSFKQVAF